MMQGRCPVTGPPVPMSAPLHASLTPDQRQELRDLRRAPELRPRVRLRAPPAGPGAGHRRGDDAGGTQKKSQNAELDLFFLDETGFSPSLPPTYTWAPPGVRPVVPYENPQRRRVNVLAALTAAGTHRHAPLT